MKANIISFTKIDIVQLRIDGEVRHELPTDEFIQRLKMAIKSNVFKHQVNYNEKKGTFTIYHNGKTYEVYYGDEKIDKNCKQIDIVQTLKELVTLTHEQMSSQNFNGELKEEIKRSLEEIITNGDDGIFYSEDDKVKYVKYWNNKLANQSVFEDFADIYTEDYFDSSGWHVGGVFLDTLFLSIMLTACIFTGTIFPYILGVIFSIIDIVLGLGKEKSYMSLLPQLIVRTYKFGVSVIKKTISKVKKKHKINSISNSIMESELSENMSEKTPEKTFSSKIDTKKPTLKGEAKETIRRILSKLPLIKDQNKIKEYGERLEDIIELFKDIPEKEYNKRYSEILFKLSYLDGELGEEVRKELAKNVLAMDYAITRGEVDSISNSHIAKRG